MIRLQKVSQRDITFLYNLRNNPTVRINSFNTKTIRLSEHKKWFEKTINNKGTKLFIIMKSGKRIGQVRFDTNKLESEINIAIEDKYRGKGYGSEAIRKAVRLFFLNNEEVTKIVAYIKQGNIASVRSFEKAGFDIEGLTRHKGHECFRLSFIG